MGMDLLAVNPTADARRFEVDGVNWCTSSGLGFMCVVVSPGQYRMPPEGPLRAQIEHRAGAVVPGRFTNGGWFRFLETVATWGVDTSSFPRNNDGDVISAAKCRRVADALAAHIDAYTDIFHAGNREGAQADVDGWRTCGGYAVW